MPGSKAATVYGQQGNRWLPTASISRTGDVYGAIDRCATCCRLGRCVAIASDPRRPELGEWFVCASCRNGWQATGPGERRGIRYQPLPAVHPIGVAS